MFLKLREEKGTKTSYTVRKELRILSVLCDEVCRLKESEQYLQSVFQHFSDLDTSVLINAVNTSKTNCQKSSIAEKVYRCRKIRFQQHLRKKGCDVKIFYNPSNYESNQSFTKNITTNVCGPLSTFLAQIFHARNINTQSKKKEWLKSKPAQEYCI